MPLSTAAVADWFTTSPGVFVTVAVIALALSAVGPALARAVSALETAVRRRPGRRARLVGTGSVPLLAVAEEPEGPGSQSGPDA